jgi:5-methyltetrahydropteroyltriglutamate--homocysteine methyltransferase
VATAFLSTVVGSMPKPDWLLPWAPRTPEDQKVGSGRADWRFEAEALKAAQDDATRLAILDQERAGIDIVSDGEQRRVSYITHITQSLDGFDFAELGQKPIRRGRRLATVGRCVGPVGRSRPILVDDLAYALRQATRPLKVTLPGPMTVVDTTLDAYYGDERAFATAVAAALNAEARALDALGPAVIQFDEPAFSRYPDKTAEWGIAALDRCLEGLKAATATHVCYGYPMLGVVRQVKDTYPEVLALLETSRVQQLALEFETPRLDPRHLRLCPSKTVLFGCVDNTTDAVETPEQVARRLLAAAEHLPPAQLQAAPDCGLIPLRPEVARAKLKALADGARLARQRVGG